LLLIVEAVLCQKHGFCRLEMEDIVEPHHNLSRFCCLLVDLFVRMDDYALRCDLIRVDVLAVV
jgi:hypothetical protein